MTFSESISTCFAKYATFSGRASRSEYWWFALFMVIGSVVCSFIDRMLFGVGSAAEPAAEPLGLVFSLALLIPSLAVGFRRLHDSGRPGWYLLIPLLLMVLFAAGMMLGVFGFTELQMAGFDEDALRTSAGGLGMAAITGFMVAQLVLLVLMIWWLTRPSQPGANVYGAEPPRPMAG